MKGYVTLGLFLLCLSNWCAGQCPAIDFTQSTIQCVGGRLNPTYSPTGSEASYYWDFCDGSLLNTPTTKYSDFVNQASSIFDTKGVFENGNYFVLIASRGNNKILRLDFGTSLGNTPNVVDLTGALPDSPNGIGLWEETSTKYALITTLSGNVYILNFGNSIGNPPSVSQISGLSGMTDLRHVKLIKESNSLFAFIAGGSTSNVFVLNFGSSILNTPVQSAIAVPQSSFLTGIDTYKDCNNSYVLVGGFLSGLHLLSFGSSFQNSPTLSTVSDITDAFGLTIEKSKDEILVHMFSNNSGVVRLNFGTSMANATPAKTILGKYSFTAAIGFSLFRADSKFFMVGANYDNNRFTVLEMPKNCGTGASENVPYPNLASYDQPGSYAVTLNVIGTSGARSSITKPIQIVEYAPLMGINSNGNCVNTPVNFSINNAPSDGQNYSWSFGDGGASPVSNPMHTYTSPLSYNVSLSVSSAEGCIATTQKVLSIFNSPQANFNLPIASPLCTNQNYTSTNTSTYDNGSNPTWQWSINGINVAATKDLNYAFTSTSTQSVVLTASIPGCSTQSTQNINTLVDGPLVTFNSPSTGCKGSVISFTNTTTGNILSQSWSFGDGNTSPLTTTTNTYSTTGPFTVSLSTTNSNGCQNSATKIVSIYSVPQPNFAIEAPPLSCERSPSQLDNLTPALVDSNISSWSWSLGDANNGSSTLKNPTYTYASAGSYNVSLLATSNFGCSKSIQKSITISPSPVANFTNLAACVNQGTRFTDASSGSVSFYQWTIQSNILSGSTPSYTFKSSGTFPITLTTTSPNGCTNQITKNVVVPVLPVVDFTVQAPCTGHPSVFRETNPDTADPAVAWNWNFGQASGTGSPVSYQFTSEGGHTVTMSTTRQSGCVYSTSENISISAGPIASFTPSIFAGAAPLSVSFNNNSTADSYQWSFGDQAQTTSTSNSPSFTYTTLGKYKPLLTAKNNLGCSDTLSTEIYVVIPHVDVAMNNLSLTNDLTSNTSKPVVTILNSGNMPLIDPVIILDLGGGASIKQKVSGMVKPGKSLSKMLELQIVPSSIKYVCAEIEAADDVNLFNNRQCVSLSHENLVMQPYPNPAISGHVTLEWIGASQENATVTVFRSNGEIVFEQHLDRLQAGLGQLEISTSSLPNGLYLIRFVGSTVTKTFRIVIAN